MNYIVTVKPEIYVTYQDIEADSEKEAFNIACKRFREEYDNKGFVDIDNTSLVLDEIKPAPDNEFVPREAEIIKGLKNGTIKIANHGGIVCCVGDEGTDNYVEFYFEGPEEEDMTPEEFRKEYTPEDIAEHIRGALDDCMCNNYDVDEAMDELRLFTKLLRERNK